MEFQERSLKGSVMKAMEFDLAFSKRVRELVAERGLVFTPNELIANDALADAVFDAGVKLLANVGLYHLDTQRVVRFSESEIRQVAKEYCDNPRIAAFGTGVERFEARYRTYNDKRPPILAAGPAGVSEQEWMEPFTQSFVELSTNKALGIGGSVSSVNGMNPKVGTLSEVECAIWECTKTREVLERCGRPGMHMGLLCTASTVGASLACIRPGFRDETNTQIGIHIIPEQKIDWTRLLLAKFCEDRGITPWISCVSVMGVLSRNGPDVAVTLIANLLGQLCYGHGSLANFFVNRMDGSWGDAECLWALSAACRASERNIRVPIASVLAPLMSQTGTGEGTLVSTALGIALTGSGFSYAWIAGSTGLEAKYLGQMMNGQTGFTREQTNDLLLRVLAETPKLEPGAMVGMTDTQFPDMYDVDTVKPKDSYRKEIEQGFEQLSKVGVRFEVNEPQ
jgi:methylamine--corrinoid protein Co-methyltransferase